MKKITNPKRPVDYKTLRIRIPRDTDLSKVMKKVQRVRNIKNKERLSDEKVWMKNHVLIEALEIGLKVLTQKKV